MDLSISLIPGIAGLFYYVKEGDEQMTGLIEDAVNIGDTPEIYELYKYVAGT